MSSTNLTNIEIDEIRLPHLNSCKLFAPDFLFFDTTSLDRKQEKKKNEKDLSSSSSEKDYNPEGKTAGERGARERGEGKENEQEEEEEGGKGVKRNKEGEWIENQGHRVFTENSRIRIKKVKKTPKKAGSSRNNSDCVEKNSTELFKYPISKKNPLHFLRIINSIASAINKLRARSQFRPLKFVSDNHFEVLNDKSHFLKSYGRSKDHIKMLLAKNELIRMAYKLKLWAGKKRLYRFFAEEIRQLGILLEEKIPVIHPDHILKIIWDFIVILMFLFLFFSYPIQISFQLPHFWIEYYFGLEKNLIPIIFTIIYGANCLIKLNQAFYDKGMLVAERSLIIKNYMKNELFFDIFGSIPISIELLIGLNPDNSILLDIRSYAEIFFFLKLFEVKRITRFLEETLHLSDKYFAFFQLFKLMITLLLFLNVMACLWHAISFYSPYPKNMMESSNYNTKNWQSRYLKALFWTVNPGRIDPQNDLELFFGFFALLATSGSMGFLISGIHNLMRILGKNAEDKRENMRKLNLYMQNKKIDFDLQGKVRKYVNYLQEISTADSEIEKDLVNKLNPSLKEELLIRANGRIIKNSPFFSKNFSEKTLRKLVFALKPNRYYPEEFICEEGEEEQEKKIYLISDGEVRLSKSDSRIKLATLQKGDMFGLYDILSDSKGHYQTVMSLGFSSIYTITNSELIRILKENPIDYETFCFLKDKFLWEKNLELTHLKCYACNLKSHLIMNCPILHYLPDPSFIILKHLYSTPIEQRTPFYPRRKVKKFNARGTFAYMLKRILRFNIDFEEVINNMEDGGSTPLVASEDEIEEEGKENSFFEFKKDSVVKARKEEGGTGGGIVGGRNLSQIVSEEDGGGFRKKTIKLIPEEEYCEDGDDGSCYGRRTAKQLTQTLIDSVFTDKDEAVGGIAGGGGRGAERRKTTKLTQNFDNNNIDGERPYWERREKSKMTYNFSERYGSETIVTTEGLEKIESRVGKAFSKEEHFMTNRFERMKSYNIYYPEYNIENIVDFLDLKRRKMKNSKKKKNNLLTPTEILTNALTPIQKHQKKRTTTMMTSELNTLSFKRAGSIKKINTFLAAN